jgi:hypothetical protein
MIKILKQQEIKAISSTMMLLNIEALQFRVGICELLSNQADETSRLAMNVN